MGIQGGIQGAVQAHWSHTADWAHSVAGAAGAPVTLPRDPAREAARRELSDPAYHRHDPSLMQRLFDWVWQQFDHLLSRIGDSGLTGGPALAVFLTVLILVALALWWRLGAPRRAARTAGSLLLDAPRRTAAQHRAAAEQHSAAGRWEEAVRERMRAVVRTLEERALLDERPGRTADEAAREAGRALPEHAAALHLGARTFDDVNYGGRSADPQTYRRLAELDDAVRRARADQGLTAAAPASGGPA